VADGRFGPLAVNVAAQRRDPDSLLNWMERLIRRRRECPEFGWGTMSLLDVSEPAVLAHQCEWDGSRVLAFHNLSAEPREVVVKLGDIGEFDRVIGLLPPAEPIRSLDAPRLELKLEAYGQRWYRLQRRGTNTAP
jgi:maltose alpha-D-glucosyltransferase/alpha-amylase